MLCKIPIKHSTRYRYTQDHYSDIAWEAVQTFDPKITDLAAHIGRHQKFLTVENGVIKEPQGGWKSHKVFALLDNSVMIIASKPLPANEESSARYIEQYKKPSDAEVLAAYKVPSFKQLKALLSRRIGYDHSNFQLVKQYLRGAFIKHADKNVLYLIQCAKKSDMWYMDLDVAASDTCELCNKSQLTVSHLLSSQHLRKYHSQFRREIPEIDVILMQGGNQNFISYNLLFRQYKNAFYHRVEQKKLTFAIEDPFFIDRFLFMRSNLQYHALPDSLKITDKECVVCEKRFDTVRNFIGHILSLNHIKTALFQDDLNWICRVLSFIQKNEDGFKMLLPSLKKRNADESEISEEEDTDEEGTVA